MGLGGDCHLYIPSFYYIEPIKGKVEESEKDGVRSLKYNFSEYFWNERERILNALMDARVNEYLIDLEYSPIDWNHAYPSVLMSLREATAHSHLRSLTV